VEGDCEADPDSCQIPRTLCGGSILLGAHDQQLLSFCLCLVCHRSCCLKSCWPLFLPCCILSGVVLVALRLVGRLSCPVASYWPLFLLPCILLAVVLVSSCPSLAVVLVSSRLVVLVDCPQFENDECLLLELNILAQYACVLARIFARHRLQN
jgi:hypothetical protein